MMEQKIEMTNDQKIEILCDMPDIKRAVGIIAAAFHEMNLKSFIRMPYDIAGETFELTFQKRNKKGHE